MAARVVCGAYLRFSHDDGDDESDSVSLQRDRVHEVEREHEGWVLPEENIFADDGWSGREMVRRPDFKACLETVMKKRFSILITRDLDRFARGEIFHVGTALQTLTDHDVKMFEYGKNGGKGDFLRLDGEHALMTAFQMYGNRQEALKASSRIKDRLLARDEANDGWTGLAPFGFRNIRRRLSDGKRGIFLDRKGTVGDIEPHPDEYPVLLLMGELLLKLQAFNAVAMELNRRKIPTPEGGSFWSSRSVSSILQAQVYRGKVVRGRMTSQDKGGTLKVVLAQPGSVRVYDRPELQVWGGEKLAKIDAVAALQSTTKARGPRARSAGRRSTGRTPVRTPPPEGVEPSATALNTSWMPT
jgi:site-specific DNA recombinase